MQCEHNDLSSLISISYILPPLSDFCENILHVIELFSIRHIARPFVMNLQSILFLRSPQSQM